MCRFLAVTADRSRPLAEHLGTDLSAFAALSSVHRDGWGIAASEGTQQPAVVKAPEPAVGSWSFERAAEELSAEQFVVHLRLASPNKEPHQSNTHPFGSADVPDGIPGLAFAHNGHVFDNAALNARVSQLTSRPRLGETDSEVYFYMVQEFMRRGFSAPVALTSARYEVAAATDYTSLNAVLSTPDGLYALRAAHPNPQQGDLDNQPRPEQFVLNYRLADGLAVVASNGWESAHSDWQSLPNEHIVFLPRGGTEAVVMACSTLSSEIAA